MKPVFLIMLLLFSKLVDAHQPDLSNLMIYEQNGKNFLVIKSSLAAFEGEVDYLFNKNAYKTPEAFQLLVIQHFQNNCFVIINNDTIKLNNPKVVLGHETMVFAELLNVPNKINSLYARNTMFKDMPSNMSELILTLKGLPQKQYILNNDNKHEVKLKVENDQWTVVVATASFLSFSNLLLGTLLSLAVFATVTIAIRRKKTTA